MAQHPWARVRTLTALIGFFVLSSIYYYYSSVMTTSSPKTICNMLFEDADDNGSAGFSAFQQRLYAEALPQCDCGDKDESASDATPTKKSASRKGADNLPAKAPMPPLDPKAPARLTSCSMMRNTGRYIEEWLAFHRMQGVDKFVIFNDYSYAVFLFISFFFFFLYKHCTATRTEAWWDIPMVKVLIDNKVIEVHNVSDHIANMEEKRIAYEKLNVAPWNSKIYFTSFEECNKTSQDSEHRFGECQISIYRECVLQARLAGDEWVLISDVDEFLFAMPAPFPNKTKTIEQIREDVRLVEKKRRERRENPPSDYDSSQWPQWSTLTSALDSLEPWTSQLTVLPTLFGTSYYHDSDWEGLLTETHTFRASLDVKGDPIFPSRFSELGSYDVYRHHLVLPFNGGKSFIRPKDVVPHGVWIHRHDLAQGGKQEYRGYNYVDPIRYNHYAYLSVEEAYDKVKNNHYAPGSDQGKNYYFSHDERVMEFYATHRDTLIADAAPRLRVCMLPENIMHPYCFGDRFYTAP